MVSCNTSHEWIGNILCLICTGVLNSYSKHSKFLTRILFIMRRSVKGHARLKPEEAILIPLLEFDQSVLEDTYCVISKQWGQTYVHRFSRLPTLYFFNPYSSLRRAAIAVTTHVCYDLCMIVIVFSNLIEMALPNSLPLLFGRVTLIFYVSEAVYETIARGFIFGSYAYLKNPWMCLDFIITVVSLPDLESDTPASFGLQSLRGIRALNLISKIPGVERMTQGIILSMLRMYGVLMIIFLFLLSVTLSAKQLYMGMFHRRCVHNLPSDSFSLNISYVDYINNESNWEVDDHHKYVMCGNRTGAQTCKENYTCLTTDADDFGYTSFDTFSLSLINSFRLLTQDEWEIVYDRIIQANGPICFLFFLPVIFLGSFFLLNLMLVVVNSTFDSVMDSSVENVPLRNYRYHSSFRFDIKHLAMYPLHAPPGILKRVFKERDEIIEHRRWMNEKFQKFKNIIALRLQVDEADDSQEDLRSMGKWKKFRRICKIVSDSKPFRYFILLTIIFNTLLMAIEHARMSKSVRITVKYCNGVITGVFAFEVILHLLADGKKYFFSWWNILDVLIVSQSIASILLNIVAEYAIFRSLRLLELVKVQQEWPALHRVISIVLSSVKNTTRLLIVMAIIIFTFAVIGNRVVGQLFKPGVEIPRWSFHSFGGSLFAVFNIFAGEWFNPLTECMSSSKLPLLCIMTIIPYYMIGYLVILNVFTAVLLSAFDSSSLEFTRKKREISNSKGNSPGVDTDEYQTEENHSTRTSHVLSFMRKFLRSSKFEDIIFVFVATSCILMAFDDVYLDQYPIRKYIVRSLNLAFTLLFVLEVPLRWIAVGANKYFIDSWMRFDFILVLLSLTELYIVNILDVSEKTVHGLRAMRALRPLRLIPRWRNLQLVVHSLVLSLPAIFHVILVVLFIWLPFAILGLHFFAGKFFRCTDGYEERVTEYIYNKTDCIKKGYNWTEMFYNFNHIGNSYLSLFQLALFTGWAELVQLMVDFNDKDLEPTPNNRPGYYAFVVAFVFLGAFFSLNMFVAVAVDTFKNSQKRVLMGKTDALLTETQRRYYSAMLRLGRKRPVVRTDRPTNKILNMCYTIIYSLWFRVLILICICANTVIISLESYKDPPHFKTFLYFCDRFFTVAYVLEFTIKILALRKFYFNDFWNIFDLILVSIHVIGDFFPHGDGESNRLSFLYAFRLLRVLRLLRLTDMLIDLRRLLHAMVASIPALMNISILLFIIIFIYSILGMSFFPHLGFHGVISTKVNFRSFVSSYLLLFRLTTAQGWEAILEALSVHPPFCQEELGQCGNKPLAVIFMVSFIVVSNIILVNIFTAVILENYIEAVMQENDVINDDNLANFYKLWKQFDPKASQFIPYEQLSDFLDQLNKEMRIPKPNHIAIAYMNLPLVEGNEIHCLNVLKGILEIKAGNVEDSATFRILCDQIQRKHYGMFPKLKGLKFIETTMQLRRREIAVRVIQSYLKRRRERKRLNK